MYHYFTHVRASRNFEPWIHFAPGSRMDDTNPWQAAGDRIVDAWPPAADVALFLAGRDWESVEENRRTGGPGPIINLVQGLGHAEKSDARYEFLSRRAIRICVSEFVAAAITATGRVNGPVITIRNGINLDELPPVVPVERREHDLCIVALKEKDLGGRLLEAIGQRYPGRLRTLLVREFVPRREFLDILARSRAALFLPRRPEGFYLPALEAMALQTLCICPDVGGNRDFCIPGTTCMVPDYDEHMLLEAVQGYLGMSDRERAALVDRARLKANEFTIEAERKQFVDILDNLNGIW